MPSSSGDKVCPICDSPLQPGSKKCGFCGTDLSIFDMEIEEPAPAPTPVVPPQPKPTVEARIEEIFSKPIMPERPSPVRQAPPTVTPEEPPEAVEEIEEPVQKEEPKPKPVPPAKEIEQGPAEYFECPQCGSLVETSANSCPKCGVLFAEEGAEMFQCPACNSLVKVDATSCPGCGAVFIEAEEEAPAAQAPPPAKKDIEPPVVEIKAQPEAVPAPVKEEEKKGLFGGLFRKGKREEEPAPPKPTKSVVRDLAAKPAEPSAPSSVSRPSPPPEVRHVREVTTPAPAIKDKGKELARMVAEMKPLLSLAREKDVEIGESKQLIDEAAVAGRERQLDRAIELVQKSKNLLMREIDAQLAKEIARLNDEIKVAREFGGDISRASTYVQEVARARNGGDVDAAFVYVDKVKKELLPITGRYNESRKKLANFKQLISDAESFLVDTKEARGLLVDAAKAMDAKDFDRLDSLIKTAQEKLYMAIPGRMNDEMRKAKDDLLDAKMKNVNITPMITILKSATNLMKAGDYAQALREMREFKDMIKKAR